MSEFDQLLNQIAGEYASAPEATALKFPPDGDYLVTIKDVTRTVSKTKNGTALVWNMPSVVVSQDEYAGDEFPISFRSTPSFNLEQIKGACRVIQGGEDPTDDIQEADRILQSAKGLSFSVRIRTSKAGYHNVSLLELVDLGEEATETAG